MRSSDRRSSSSSSYDAWLHDSPLLKTTLTDSCFPACVVIGYLANYWNRLIFPESCRDSTMDKQPDYITMIRSAGSWSSFGKIVQMLMIRFSWRHLVMLSDMQPSATCSFGVNSVLNWFLSADAKASNYSTYFIKMETTPSAVDMDFYLNSVRVRTRGKFSKSYDQYIKCSFCNAVTICYRY